MSKWYLVEFPSLVILNFDAKILIFSVNVYQFPDSLITNNKY